ncbi:MAG: HEPN domain-containing protein [Candidatus Cloacimonetes bacterium]|nr:HEPN domain-containing protein [Candidatus Cloacimonadota bacterium]MCF7814229.1 HEPN domain-containing protein [Candidatus Cloacimonadota bacterium]MCF7868436.1 HEPN domain-containing protein [Candidatus Cloacimonadota bacterium]MCF7883944.1 HEPN domain-containing protein [Candidatus Cloacimonadota bacterium]
MRAHIVKAISAIPPKSHNLIFLSEKTDIIIPKEMEIFFGILMRYHLQGRYPDYNPNTPDLEKTKQYFEKTKEIFIWLQNKL